MMENTYTELFDAAKSTAQSDYAKTLLEELNKSEGTPWSIEIFKSVFSAEFPQWGRTAAVFLSIAVALKFLQHVWQKRKISDAVQYTQHCLFSLSVFLQFFSMLKNFTVYIRDVLSFLGILLPAFGTVTATGGNIATASASGLWHSLFLSVTQLFLQNVLPPVFTFFCGMALLDTFVGDGRFLALSSAIKNLLFTALAILLGVFFIVMRTQNIAASNSDAASAKALRLLVARAIPIVGGTLGDALRYVSAVLTQVKNGIGNAAVVFLLGMYLPIFLHLFLYEILLSLLQFVSGFFALSGQKGVYTHMKYSVDFLLAVYSAIFVIGIINIGIFMQATPVLFQ